MTSITAAKTTAASRVETRLGFFLTAVLALSPIPFGSARPLAWACLGILIGAAAVVYSAMTLRKGDPIVAVRIDRLSIAVFGCICVFLVLQIVPLPAWIATVSGPDGIPISAQSISLAPGSTVLMLIRMLTFGLTFLLALAAATGPAMRRLLIRAVFIVVVAHAGYALIALTLLGDPILWFEKWSYHGSATGTFVNQNSFATFLSFGLVCGAVLLAQSFMSGAQGHDRRLTVARVLDAIGIVVVLTALFATKSRMGTFSGLAGASLAVVLAAAGYRRAVRAYLFFALLLVLAGGAVILLSLGGLFGRLDQVEPSLSVRLALFGQVLQMIASRPWTGYGGGAFELAYPLFHRPPVDVDLVWEKAHNTYLGLWTELGVIVGTLPLAMLGMAALRLWRSWRASTDRLAQTCALGVLTTAALHSLLDFSLEIEANTLVFVALLGFGLAAARPAQPAE